MGFKLLLPGEYHIAKRPIILETLVGSCVSVCIYNIKSGIAAMNHFLQSEPTGGAGVDIGYYGSTATGYIIKRLFEIDDAANHYKAQIFGGAAVIKSTKTNSNIGKANAEIAVKVLKKYRIRIVHEEVGGNRGRRVKFDTGIQETFCRFAGEVSKKFARV